MSEPARPPRPLMLAAILGVAVMAGLGAWVMLRGEGDRPVPPRPLPTPRPASETPLSAGRDGGGDGGWRWINPRPRALPTWNAVDVAERGRIALAGKRGAAARVDRRGLWLWPSGTSADLHAVAWLDDASALVAGDDGTLRLLRVGGGSDAIETSTRVPMRAIARLATGGRALVAGDDGTLLSFAGGRISRVRTGIHDALLGIAVSGDAAWVVGEHGVILRVEGTTATREPSGINATLRAVASCGADATYAAGDDGRVLRRTAAGWKPLGVPGHVTWTSATCEGDRVAVAGLGGDVLLLRGDAHVRLESGSDRAWNAVAHARGEGTWVVGAGGRMAAVREDHLELLSSGPTAGVRDMATLGGAIVGVGEYGRVFMEREEGVREATSPTEAGLGGIAALAEDRLVAVGDEGAIVEVTSERIALKRSPTRSSLRDVIAAGGTMLAVGTEGTIVRGRLEALTVRRVEAVGDLWGLSGTPDAALAVGVNAVVLRVGATSSSRVPCDAARGATLRAVLQTSDGAWAVGDGGTIVRIETAGCVVEHTGGPNLHGIGLGPTGRPIAVGELASMLERASSGTWSRVTIDAGDATLRAIVPAGPYVYLLGTGGLILRHTRPAD